MKLLKYTAVSVLLSASEFSYADEKCFLSVESIKAEMSEIDSERKVDINNDGVNEAIVNWGCGTSGCNSSLIIKKDGCFSVVLERENIVLHKEMPKFLSEMYRSIKSDYMIAESDYSDCLGYNSSKEMFIFNKKENKYELFYEEKVSLCNFQNHLNE